MKKMKKFLLTALAALVTFSSCGGALADAELPYTTYNYDYWGDIVYTPAAYVPAGSITGASSNIMGSRWGRSRIRRTCAWRRTARCIWRTAATTASSC